MDLTLAQLNTFAQVAATGHFTRAAAELGVTQLTVSRQMRALERLFGLPLLQMVGHHAELTEAGQFLAVRAREIVNQVAALEQELQAFAQTRTGWLGVGATFLTGTVTLPALLARFHRQYPGIHLQVELAPATRLATQIRQGSLGLALAEGNLPPEFLEDIVSFPYALDHLLLLVSLHHPFARRRAIALAELTAEVLIWEMSNEAGRLPIEHALMQAQVHPRAVLELPGGEGVTRAVEAGLGIAFLSSLLGEQAVREHRLVPVEVLGLEACQTLSLLARRDRTLSPPELVLKDLLLAEALTMEQVKSNDAEQEKQRTEATGR